MEFEKYMLTSQPLSPEAATIISLFGSPEDAWRWAEMEYERAKELQDNLDYALEVYREEPSDENEDRVAQLERLSERAWWNFWQAAQEAVIERYPLVG